jgi:hypothetical protein
VENGGDCVTEPVEDVAEGVYTAGENAVDFFGNSYYDLNITAGCGLVGTAGVQFSWNEGVHPYLGGGVAGFCGGTGSFTVGPYQRITTGLACGAQGGYNFPLGQTGIFQIGAGPTGQVGSAGIRFDEKEGGIVGSEFAEIGVGGSLAFGIPGVPASLSGTCFYVY